MKHNKVQEKCYKTVIEIFIKIKQIAVANLNEQQYTQQAIGNVQQATTQGVSDLRGRVVRLFDLFEF